MQGNGPLAPYPHAKPARRWLPAAIIGAAIIVAAALIGAALILSRGENTNTAVSPGAPVAPSASPTAPASENTTCDAWRTTRPALDAIPPLPAGWDWNTPNIDTYINNMSASITRALDLFEPKITEQPADVATAAQDYVDARRNELRMLHEGTYTTADGVAGNMALAELNRLCGTR